MGRASFMNQTYYVEMGLPARLGQSKQFYFHRTHEIKAPLNIVSYAACFITPSMTVSSPFSCTEFLRCR